jgi:tRNA isopentenyl-2-thiomethyl-A-37 hydroxylase MiaE
LASPHRHIFHFRVWIDVFHNDRDVEFIQFKRWLEKLYSSNQGVLSLDYKSCEMISDDLYLQIATRYPDRAVWIEVAEDGENGALIKYELSRPSLSIKI